jgi:hypothetical protein
MNIPKHLFHKFLDTRKIIIGLSCAITLALLFRGVIFQHKILFPANFLATFYSPWSTQRYPEYPNGIPHKPIGGNDQIRMFYPYRTFVNESLSHWQLPLWNPYNFAGSPILANFQSATFYPLNILYVVFPQIDAWSLLVVLQPLLGTYFMYLYLNTVLTKKSAAYLGALSFGFSGFISTWSQENAVVGHCAVWFPLILYAWEKNFLFNSTETSTGPWPLWNKWFALLTFALVCCTLAGHYQFSLYILGASFCYALFCIKVFPNNKKRNLLTIISAFTFTLGIAAIQLLPSIEAFTQSPRSSTSSSSVIDNSA